jgi:hypothetical protein
MRVAAFCILCVVATSFSRGSQTTPEGSDVLERFLAANDRSLVACKALRRLTVDARGGTLRAQLLVQTSLDPENGFQYEVQEERGSELLRSRVLHPVLEAERAASRHEKGARGALTHANYRFDAGEVTSDGLLRVAITPRRKDELLIDGSLLLTSTGADLVRMEGTLVKRPSFWTRKVRIVRQYARINGVRVPVAMGSTADVLFAGKSTFSMDYEYQSINGVPVAPNLNESR